MRILHAWYFSIPNSYQLVEIFSQCQVPLPSGGFLTPRGLQTLGLSGLGSSTGFERLHYMYVQIFQLMQEYLLCSSVFFFNDLFLV